MGNDIELKFDEGIECGVVDGVPTCDIKCKSNDGKRCAMNGRRTGVICEPGVVNMHDKLVMLIRLHRQQDLSHHATEQEKRSAECLECGVVDCPHDEPLHYHHDGCPACD